MSPYFVGGLTMTVIAFILTLIWYANRAGRNAARVRSERQGAATANEEAAASQRALNARTNGIRSNNELLGTLDKGEF
ncbi:hypothetical protein CO583_01980 [Parasaccharibacter sp. TMW2.1882]|uniref:hypothetical protein n=1 Tax=Parasaccharibacter sp. TMW2.1882 TaxID=2039286 RepID=UPI0020116434|nr:hypothetical protein [Parasaccharibacter sp. TMW2.1882]MCL1496279.1 hypothetical protein [Parasaccharibacter sp. TMW2.1882]